MSDRLKEIQKAAFGDYQKKGKTPEEIKQEMEIRRMRDEQEKIARQKRMSEGKGTYKDRFKSLFD